MATGASDGKDPQQAEVEARAIAIKDEGNVFFKAGNYQSAISRYSQAISVAPMLASLYGNRSAAWFMIAQVSGQPKAFEECIRDCTKAVELDPSLYKVYQRAIKAMVHLDRVSQAADLADKALKELPDTRELQEERAAVSALGQEIAEARSALEAEEWQEAAAGYAALESKMLAAPSVKLGLARASLGLANPAQALRHTLAAINIDGSSAEAYYWRGVGLARTRNLDQAKKHFQEALRLNPDHTLSQVGFKRVRKVERAVEEGKAAMEKREYNDAVDSYTAAMEVDPENKLLNATFAVERGNAYLRLKQFDDAVADCTLAIENDQSITAPLVTRSMAYQALGDHEGAVRDLEAALALDSESLVLKERLKKAQVELRKSRRVDYYAVLGITSSASVSEIKAAYKKAALLWHPDKHGQDEESQAKAREMFNKIGEAQEMLADPRRKALYDEGYDKEMIEKRMQMEEQQAAMFGGGGGFGGFPGGCCEEDMFGGGFPPRGYRGCH